MLPPQFQRHCAAVAVWGPNMMTMMELITSTVAALQAPGMRGSAGKLLSWCPCKFKFPGGDSSGPGRYTR
jgi:hypothetical protein